MLVGMLPAWWLVTLALGPGPAHAAPIVQRPSTPSDEAPAAEAVDDGIEAPPTATTDDTTETAETAAAGDVFRAPLAATTDDAAATPPAPTVTSDAASTTEPIEPLAEPTPSPTETTEPGDPTRDTEPTHAAKPERPPHVHPRLVLAAGPLVGPHAFGNEECNAELAECQTKGSFFGLGGQVELRARVWKPIFVHLRGLAIKNVSPNDPVYAGVLGAGAGLGAYARRVFGRAEYVYVHALGDNHFEPPFFDGAVATDTWGHHAGVVAVGFRQPLPRNLSVELWGGLMLGPRSVRRVAQEVPDERRLTTFQVGLDLAWDVWR